MHATFPGVEFLRILCSSKSGGKVRRLMSTSSIKRQIRRIHVVVVQWTSKKCTKKLACEQAFGPAGNLLFFFPKQRACSQATKKRDASAELLFWWLNLLIFWSRSCLSSLIPPARQATRRLRGDPRGSCSASSQFPFGSYALSSSGIWSLETTDWKKDLSQSIFGTIAFRGYPV